MTHETKYDDETLRKPKTVKTFFEVKDKHEDPVTSLDNVHVHKSILYMLQRDKL